MWLLLVPMVVVLFVLVVSAVFAGMFWMLGATWPWLLIGLGMWLLWRGDGRHHRARRQRAAWSTGARCGPMPQRGEQSARHRPASPAGPAKGMSAAELPIDIQVKV